MEDAAENNKIDTEVPYLLLVIFFTVVIFSVLWGWRRRVRTACGACGSRGACRRTVARRIGSFVIIFHYPYAVGLEPNLKSAFEFQKSVDYSRYRLTSMHKHIDRVDRVGFLGTECQRQRQWHQYQIKDSRSLFVTLGFTLQSHLESLLVAGGGDKDEDMVVGGKEVDVLI